MTCRGGRRLLCWWSPQSCHTTQPVLSSPSSPRSLDLPEEDTREETYFSHSNNVCSWEGKHTAWDQWGLTNIPANFCLVCDSRQSMNRYQNRQYFNYIEKQSYQVHLWDIGFTNSDCLFVNMTKHLNITLKGMQAKRPFIYFRVKLTHGYNLSLHPVWRKLEAVLRANDN